MLSPVSTYSRAMSFVAELGDPARFGSARQLRAYLGLAQVARITRPGLAFVPAREASHLLLGAFTRSAT